MKAVAFAAVLSRAGAVSPSFEAYKVKFDKSYESAEKESHAKGCWEINVDDIQARLATSKAEFDENEFTDVCPDEFAAMMLTSDQSNGFCTGTVPAYDKKADPSQAIDWRDHGYVNPVKNQKACGSCWAFSSIGCMEGAWFKSSGQLVSLSEQELVACDPNNNGCSGGMPGEAFDFAVKMNGIASEADYPYTAGGGDSGKCNDAATAKHAAWFSSWRYLPSHSGGGGEPVLLAAIQNEGPISIVLNANAWHNYASGILTAKDCPGSGGIDHAVLAVGYAQNGNSPYYIVRNSWGPTWGEKGYVRLSYGENTCNLQNCVSWLIVGGKGPSPPPAPVPPPACSKLTDQGHCTSRDDCCWGSFFKKCDVKGSTWCQSSDFNSTVV